MPSSTQDIIARTEKEVMTGRGRWIADFNESFRDFRVQDVMFDVLIKGNTRMKGFILSRVFSHFLNPNYEVAFFILSVSPGKRIDRRHLQRPLSAIQWYMERNYVKWSWLVVVGEGLDETIRRAVESVADQSIGVVYIDSASGETINSNSYLGRQIRKYVKV